jgi:hypothetical protein
MVSRHEDFEGRYKVKEFSVQGPSSGRSR